MSRNGAAAWGVAIGMALAGCGGANDGERRPGNPSGGSVLASGDVAMHAGGRWVVTRHKQALLVMDLLQGEQRKVNGVLAPERLAFGPASSGDAAFVIAQPPTGAESDRELLKVDLAQGSVVWRHPLATPVLGIDTADVVGNILVTQSRSVEIRSMQTGAHVAAVITSNAVRDLDVTTEGQRLVVTENTTGSGANVHTRIAVHSTADAALLCSVTVPNCASDLVVAPDAVRAFLAPTACGRDPVSVMDLDPEAEGGCAFRENLPGFGPVLLTGNAKNTVVAFMDNTATDATAALMPEAVKNSDQRYHLMFINAQTLEYDTVPFGNALPRYATNPAGSHLLLDTWTGDDPMLTVLELGGRTQTRVAPTQVRLNLFAFATRADRAFVVDQGLVRIDVAAAQSEVLPLDFKPISLNVTPDGEALVLTREDSPRVYFYSVQEKRVAREFNPDLLVAN